MQNEDRDQSIKFQAIETSLRILQECTQPNRNKTMFHENL